MCVCVLCMYTVHCTDMLFFSRKMESSWNQKRFHVLSSKHIILKFSYSLMLKYAVFRNRKISAIRKMAFLFHSLTVFCILNEKKMCGKMLLILNLVRITETAMHIAVE